MRQCFAFDTGSDTTTLSIFDEIGFWGVQAKDFLGQLAGVKSKELSVEINSPGGDVFAGLAIYNALRASGKEITVKVLGVAASAASLIAMAGDKIVMPKNTFLMIHNPWSMVAGNASELRDAADMLDKIGSSLKQTYASRTGLSDEEISTMLEAETWLTADEALAKGFATEVQDEVKISAKFDVLRANLPDAVRAAMQGLDEKQDDVAPSAPEEPNLTTLAEQIITESVESGFSAQAKSWALAYTTIEQARERINSAIDIRNLCNLVGKSELTPTFIREGKTLEATRQTLAAILASDDENSHTDTTRKDVTQGSAVPKVTTSQLWASHRKPK